MMQTLEIVAPVLAVGILLLYPMFPGSRETKGAHASFDKSIEDLRATHYRYFTVVRQALSHADESFLRRRVAPVVARAARRERRAVARKFLAGLQEDFSNLDRLARMIAALSPNLDRQQEAERLKLTLKFRFVYAMVWARLYVGSIPLNQFEQLAGLIGKFADRMEQAMASVNALSAEPLGLSSQS